MPARGTTLLASRHGVCWERRSTRSFCSLRTLGVALVSGQKSPKYPKYTKYPNLTQSSQHCQP
eukprot:11538827-Alexandrium_andersonii.AAC.1